MSIRTRTRKRSDSAKGNAVLTRDLVRKAWDSAPLDCIVGVDPGLSGAVAAIHRLGRPEVFDAPTKFLVDCPTRREYDAPATLAILDRLRGDDPSRVAAWIEDVRRMPKGMQNCYSVSSLCEGIGIFRAILEAACGVQVTFVRPQKWKSFIFGRKAEKIDSLALARELYPSAPLGMSKHDGRAEALLIATFGLLNAKEQ